jgi:hypothetical protein
LAKSEEKYWRIVAGQKKQTDDKFEPESLILGDWLRHDYISIGFEDPKQISRKRFDEMQDGDKIAVITDEYLWAIGEIKGFVYRKESENLHNVRRNVIWHKIVRLEYDTFPNSLKDKLRKPHTVVPLDKNDWHTILAHI